MTIIHTVRKVGYFEPMTELDNPGEDRTVIDKYADEPASHRSCPTSVQRVLPDGSGVLGGQRKEGRMNLDDLTRRVPELDYEKRVDNCPECMARNITPATVERVPNGAQCAYKCHVCGCDWTTSWWEGEG